MAEPGWAGRGEGTEFHFTKGERMRSIEFTLTGEMPLLMHQDDVELADELEAWRKDPAHKNISKAGDDRSPAWTWQTYCYSDGEHLAIPSANIMVCLRSAGTQMILKKQKTFKELTQSGLLITSEFCEFTVGGKQIAVSDLEDMREKDFKAQANECRKHGFRLFVKRARVGSSKHVRVRPRFDSWQVRGTMPVRQVAV